MLPDWRLGALVGAMAYVVLTVGLSLYARLNHIAPSCTEIFSAHALLLAVRAGRTFPGLPLWGQLSAQQLGLLAWIARYVLPGLFPTVIAGWLVHSQLHGGWRLALGWLLAVLLTLTYIGGTVITLVLAHNAACR